MYTTVDRLIRDTCVVNYKSHCHQIKSTEGYMIHAILSRELAGVAGGNPERVIFGGEVLIYFREEIRNPSRLRRQNRNTLAPNLASYEG